MARVLALSKRTAQNESNRQDSGLTDRELEVLSAAASGERSKEIAFRLRISERTVKAHLSSIYTKLNVDSRAAAVALAVGRGLLDDKRYEPTRGSQPL